MEDGETEDQVVAFLVSVYQPTFGFDIRYRDVYGPYQKVIRKGYSPLGVYEDYMEILLYDTENRCIYERTESRSKETLEITVRKYFYNTTQEEFMFIYNPEGLLSGVTGGGSPFVPENDHFISVAEFPIFFPTFLTNHPYYKDSNP